MPITGMVAQELLMATASVDMSMSVMNLYSAES